MEKVKEFFRHNGKAIFIWVATFTGAYAFLKVLGESWQALPVNSVWLAMIIAALILPKVYARLRRRRYPLVILAAEAFREGFLAISSIAPNFSKLVGRAKRLFGNLVRK